MSTDQSVITRKDQDFARRLARGIERNLRPLGLAAAFLAATTVVAAVVLLVSAHSALWPVVLLLGLGMIAAMILTLFAQVIRLAVPRWHYILARLDSMPSSPLRFGPAYANSSAMARIGTSEDAARRLSAGANLVRSALEREAGALKPSGEMHFQLPARGPAITVVVPLFNERRFVADAIRSLKRQTFGNFVAIIVDDAATDESVPVSLAAIGSDDRFRIVRHLRNQGLGAARNTGLRLAETPFVTFLDADDLLLPHALETRLARFTELQDERVAGVYCGVLPAPEEIDADYRPATPAFQGRVYTFMSAGGECPFNAHAPILRADVLRKLGGFDETLRHGCEDWDLWQRALRHGYVFMPVADIGAIYRQKQGSMVRAMPVEHLKAAKRILNWAHAPLAAADIVPGTPYVFDQPLESYSSSRTLARRAAQFAAMAHFHGDEAFEEVVVATQMEFWSYFIVEPEIVAQVRAGVVRFLGLHGSDTADIEGDLGRLTDAIVARLDRRAASLKSPPPMDQHVDAAFFPTTVKQVAAMVPVARALRAAGSTMRFVSAESILGDQGVETALAEAGEAWVSYNRHVFQEEAMPARMAVVMRPYDGVVREAALRAGGPIEIEDSAAPVDYPDENLPAEPVARFRLGETRAEQIGRTIATMLRAGTDVHAKASQRLAPAQPHADVQSREERRDLASDYGRLLALRDHYRGERCFIIGNGPSLNTMDLSKLRGEHTFAVNGIFYKSEEMGFAPTFYVVEDTSVMEENREKIVAYQAQYKLFPTTYRKLHPAAENTLFFTANRGFYERSSPAYCVPRFSVDAARRVFCGQSVTHINLQLAYYFGFSTVYLIGMDFSYVVPKSAVVRGDIILSTADDPNHFHKDYFGAGKTWKDPKLNRVKLNYQASRDIFEASGRQIFNATHGGALDVFPRRPFDSLF